MHEIQEQRVSKGLATPCVLPSFWLTRSHSRCGEVSCKAACPSAELLHPGYGVVLSQATGVKRICANAVSVNIHYWD